MGPKNTKKKNTIYFRKKYVDHSRRFLDWVNTLGLENSFLGSFFYRIDTKFGLRHLGALFVFCLFLSFLLFYDFDFSVSEEAGEIASADIKSPISLKIVDETATEEKRIEASRNTPPIFDYDADVYEPIYNRIYKSFREMRKKIRAINWYSKERKREVQIKEFLQNKEEFEEMLELKVSPRVFEWLTAKQFNVRIENILIRTLVKWSSNKIVDGLTNATKNEKIQLVVRNVEGGDIGEGFAISQKEVLDIRRRKDFSLDGVRGVKRLKKRDRNEVLGLARALQVPNLTFNKKESEQRRKVAREAVLPVQISIEKGQVIVRGGSVVRPIHESIMLKIQELQNDNRTDFLALLTAFLFVLLILVFFSYAQRFTLNKIKLDPRDYYVMASVTLIVVALTKFFLFMTNAAFIAKYGSLIPATAFLFSAPVAAGPMLVGLVVSWGEVVWIFTSFLAIALSFMVDMDFNFLMVSLVGGIAAARGVFQCEKRNDIYWAGLRTGAVNALMIIFVTTLKDFGSGGLLRELMWTVPAGLCGGVLSSMVAMIVAPLLETAFNYTTDIKLLELSSLTHPLMRQLMVKAPGTYHHCLSVGTMVEEAAYKIEANALLAKVMAYYHDIGKMEHAQYFIENQRPGFNPHDHISPYMSKTVIVAHVKDGAEMAIEHKLGRPLVDAILQHHGTTLISYFYNKALEDSDSSIDESEFRYPGPKPQFKEAALVMIADSIEAAARCIDEPTAARLTHLVENIIHSKIVDGQLNECDLTFEDLSVIEQSFKTTILSIYHSRIEYPSLKTPKETVKKEKKNKHSSDNIA